MDNSGVQKVLPMCIIQHTMYIHGEIGQKCGFNLVSKAHLTNAVIAMSVASHGFTIQTKNPGDFQLIAEFRPFDWETV